MNRSRAAGFVITLEFLLVMALFVVPVMVGAILLGRKLYTLYLTQRDFIEQPYSRAVVWDSSNAGPTPPPNVIGPVVGYDQFEAPQVIFRDESNQGGVILGVRRDRFTSYGEVFYSDAACSANPMIRAHDASASPGTTETNATATGIGMGGFVGLPPVGYPPNGFAYQMQGGSYAMGSGNVLYRSTDDAGSPITAGMPDPLYVWKSQDISPTVGAPPDPPCFRVPDGVTINSLTTPDVVIDFDNVYTAPYRLAFPSPTAAPTLSCPDGECAP